MAETSRGVIGKISGSEQQMLKDMERFGKMADAVRQGKHAEAMGHYAAMSPGFQSQKPVLMVRLQAAMNLEEARYVEAIDELAKLYPDDPCLDLIRIDSLFLKKQYKEAREAVDRLDRALGGDPHLETLRASLHLEAKEFAQARQAIQRAIEKTPNNE